MKHISEKHIISDEMGSHTHKSYIPFSDRKNFFSGEFFGRETQSSRLRLEGGRCIPGRICSRQKRMMAIQTMPKPANWAREKGSRYRNTPSRNWMDGAEYCRMPIMVREMRRAAAANMTSGRVVTTPTPARSRLDVVPVCRKTPVPETSLMSSQPRASGKSRAVSRVSPSNAPRDLQMKQYRCQKCLY